MRKKQLVMFRNHLALEEKSAATIEKYLRDAGAFLTFLSGRKITKELCLAYKQKLQEDGYAVRSINSMLASVNSLLRFMGWDDCKVKSLRLQRQVYCTEEKELTKAEYMRLLNAANNEQLKLIMQTICSTGIRISELKYFTVECIKRSEVSVQCKSKIRTIFIPSKLRSLLMKYIKKLGIYSGPIFITHNGKPLDRSSIWAQMKRLCALAEVNPAKVFPHNLRKLFARTFYSMEKDIAKLADILGHGSIETTRIYIISTGHEHRKKMERLGLLI